ncbi:hypothetical protein Q5O24_08050 [Eubacteriaceae bacterium ES3]|nr:hypothetical protein Q5O24_08050 [Eubacteriaceae bacterium ES3]
MSKFAAILLVVLMVFSMIPISAMAMESEVVGESEIQIDESLAEVEPVPVLETPVAEDPYAMEPVVEEPAEQEPEAVVEEPIAEEPVSEVPVEEEQAVVETADIAEEVEVEDDSVVEVAATAYLALFKGGIEINVLADNVGDGYTFDVANNELTLTDFTGEQLIAMVFGTPLSVILEGTNTLATDTGNAIDVDGDLMLGGSGTLNAFGDGGIAATGDITIAGGEYNIIATAEDGDDTAGTAAGTMDMDGNVLTPGEIVINGGKFDIIATAEDGGDATGIWSSDDIIVNGGFFDIYTYSVDGLSTGMYANSDLIFNGGYSDILSETENGTSTCLWAGDWLGLRYGCFDLVALGGENPRALYSSNDSIYTNPCYGDVDTTASELHLCCTTKVMSDNPKTGVVDDYTTQALIASLGLLILIGSAIVIKKSAYQK